MLFCARHFFSRSFNNFAIYPFLCAVPLIWATCILSDKEFFFSTVFALIFVQIFPLVSPISDNLFMAFHSSDFRCYFFFSHSVMHKFVVHSLIVTVCCRHYCSRVTVCSTVYRVPVHSMQFSFFIIIGQRKKREHNRL